MTGKGARRKALGWLGVVGFGAIGGIALGNLAIGDAGEPADRANSYAEFTGNPDATRVESLPVDPCYGCADSYGASMRLKSAREDRMDGEFRELGAVAIDYGSAPADDYRYGGRFDDPDAARPMTMQSPVPVPAVQPTATETGASEDAKLAVPATVPPTAEDLPTGSEDAQ